MLRDPDSGRAVPMLLMLKSELKGVADLETELENNQMELIADLLGRGVRDGVLPDDLDPHLVAAQLYGPMLFAHLTGMVSPTNDFADAMVDSFLAAHRIDDAVLTEPQRAQYHQRVGFRYRVSSTTSGSAACVR